MEEMVMDEDGTRDMCAEDVSEFEKWKKAVVHLESARSRKTFDESVKISLDVQRRQRDGTIGLEEAHKILRELHSRKNRFTGTAIFIEHNSLKYLVTARHVVYDAKFSIPLAIPPQMNEQGQGVLAKIREREEKITETAIFPIIFLVPSLDDFAAGSTSPSGEFLMNLMAGPYAVAAYTYSRPNLDIAVISLDHGEVTKRFAETLLSRGYRPVSIEDISDGPSTENSEVFSVGYPESVSTWERSALHPAEYEWRAGIFSLPAFSYGHVAMLHPKLPLFWCDLSIYPGNSGGPVVENGRMVGIVLGQPLLEEEIQTNSEDQDSHKRPETNCTCKESEVR
jgi:hypothetical protein